MSVSDLPDTNEQANAHAREDASEHDCPDAGPPCGKSAGRPRAADQQARLQNLLQTAAGLFMENGYSKVSLEMIARQAHVAVRTIYVKFGGKAGLLNAIIAASRARYFSSVYDMQSDTRPMELVLGDFGRRFAGLISMPGAKALQRMVLAEAKTNPELVQTFYQAGPGQTRELLNRYFGRPDVAALFRGDMPTEMLTTHFLNCIMGDQLSRLVLDTQQSPPEDEIRRQADQGLALFLRGARR